MLNKYRLDKLCIINSGGTPSRRKGEYYNEGKIPWAKISDIESSNGVIYNTEEKITPLGLKSIRNKIFPKGSLLISIYGSVGKVAFTGVDMSSNQAILGIRLNKEGNKLLSLEYLKYWFEINLDSLKNKAVGGILKNISATIVRGLEIPLPSLQDQKRIAKVLSDCETLINKRKESIALLDELLKSTFLEMFGDPIRNEKGWEFDSLENITHTDCPLTYGIVQPGQEFQGGLPVVRPVDLNDDFVDKTNLKLIDPEISKKYKRTVLNGGEILFVVRGTTGVVSIAKDDLKGANVTRGISPIWLKDGVNNRFVLHLIKSKPFQNLVSKKTYGIALKQINIRDLRLLPIIQPDEKLQNKFTSIVQKVESIKLLYQTHLQELENLYGSLSQKAFKGELDLGKVEIEENVKSTKESGNNFSSDLIDYVQKKGDEIVSKKVSINDVLKHVTNHPKKRDITNMSVYEYYGVPEELWGRRENADFEIADWDIYAQFLLKDSFRDKRFTIEDIRDQFQNFFMNSLNTDFDDEAWKNTIFRFLDAKPPLLKQLFDENDKTIKLKLTDEAYKA